MFNQYGTHLRAWKRELQRRGGGGHRISGREQNESYRVEVVKFCHADAVCVELTATCCSSESQAHRRLVVRRLFLRYFLFSFPFKKGGAGRGESGRAARGLLILPTYA